MNEDQQEASRAAGSWEERVLVLLLRGSGVLLLFAFLAVVMPEAWMAEAHVRLGLGTFPASPLVDYLTRSISMLYGIHGGLVILVSMDLRRFAPVVVFCGISGLVFGSVMIAIDVQAGMPMSWTLCEGPSILIVGALVLWLVRRLRRWA